MNRENYKIKELVNNPSFRRYVKGLGTYDDIEAWNTWINHSESNRLKAKSAIFEIAGFQFAEPVMPDIKKKWSDLHEITENSQITKFPKKRNNKNSKSLNWAFRFAAIFLLTSLVGLGVFQYYQNIETVTNLEQVVQMKTISTGEGEQKTLSFSNGSRVVLNSNSNFTYRLGLIHNQTIEVILEGEAWFDVQNKSSSKKPAFAVTTPDGVIRDIGTKFLVTVQKDWSRVVLQEGMVEIEPASTNNPGQHKELEKFQVEIGEMVQFTKSDILRREKVNTTFYSSWATGFMEFQDKELWEFANHLEGLFNVNVQIVDQNLTDIALEGAVYFRSLEGLIRSISEVTGIPVFQSEDRNTIYIGNPNDLKPSSYNQRYNVTTE